MSCLLKIVAYSLAGLRAVAFTLILTIAASTAALADPTPQPPDQTPIVTSPNFLNITELSGIDLHVAMSFLGYDFTGDLVPIYSGAPWGIGPHFNAFVSPSTLDNVTGIGRVYWLQPGSSLADPDNAKLSGLAITSCFCGSSGPNLQFLSNIPFNATLSPDPSNFWRQAACRGNGQFDNCPILADGASQIIPISGDLPVARLLRLRPPR